MSDSKAGPSKSGVEAGVRSKKQDLKSSPGLKLTPQISENPRQAIVILGMHRSGTSALGGALHLLGCAAPKTHIEADNSNPSGYWESLEISRFNDRLLQAGGSVWHDWQRFNSDWESSAIAPDFMEEALRLLEGEYGNERLFLVKDPRMCLLMPFWNKVFAHAGVMPRGIIIQRNPFEVAGSLTKRDGFSTVKGLLIWLRYMLDAERFSRGLPRTFTTYDQLIQNFRVLPEQFEDRLDIIWPRKSDRVYGELANFLSGNLRHHKVSQDIFANPTPLSPWIARVFNTLQDWSENGENLDARSIIDEVYKEFADIEAPLGSVLWQADAHYREVNQLKKKLDISEASSREAKEQINTLTEEHRGIVASLSSKIEDFHVNQTSLKEEVENLKSKIDFVNLELERQVKISNEKEIELNQCREKILILEEDRKKQELELVEKENVLGSIKFENESLKLDIEKERKNAGGLIDDIQIEKNKSDALLRDIEKKDAEISAIVDEYKKYKSASEATMELRFSEISKLVKTLYERELEYEALQQEVRSMRENLRQRISNIVKKLLIRAEKPWRNPRATMKRKSELLQSSGLFDADWYRDAYPDISEAGVDPLVHYINHGREEGRWPLPELFPHPQQSPNARD